MRDITSELFIVDPETTEKRRFFRIMQQSIIINNLINYGFRKIAMQNQLDNIKSKQKLLLIIGIAITGISVGLGIWEAKSNRSYIICSNI